MKLSWNKAALCLLVIGVAVGLRWFAVDAGTGLPVATYSQFLQQVRQGNVGTVTIAAGGSAANPATYRTKDGHTARTVLPRDYRDAVTLMQDGSVDIEIKDAPFGPIVNALPFLVLAGFWLFMMGKLRSGTRVA